MKSQNIYNPIKGLAYIGKMRRTALIVQKTELENVLKAEENIVKIL